MIIGLDIEFLILWTLISFIAGGIAGICFLLKVKDKAKK
jgi:hypothetical protein